MNPDHNPSGPKAAEYGWKSQRRLTRYGLIAAVALLVFCLLVMMANYRFPKFFLPEPLGPAKGLAVTRTIIVISEDLFGNWLPNDRLWPTVFMDNPQNFQLGQLEALRHTSRLMRESLARQQSASSMDPDCDAAFTLMANDPRRWLLPSPESKYQQAIKHYKNYEQRLLKDPALFRAAGDNLSDMMEQYVSLLGDVNTRLANAVRRRNPPPLPAADAEGGAARPSSVYEPTPWSKIDDNFYQAQGVAYVLRQIMVAVQIDFEEILAIKNSRKNVADIIEVLDGCQFQPLLVLNGDLGSLTANHSSQLQAQIENARQRMRNLNDILNK